MLRHADIWQGIDKLARENGLSPSGLARRAGLDPTTFNKSKRFNRDGKPRWPGTESIAKILTVTDCPLDNFVALVGDGGTAGTAPKVPLIGYAQAGRDGYFDDAGYPAGHGWDDIAFPDLGDSQAYGLKVSGDSMEPVYRHGDVIIVSPGAAVRNGDRVVVKTTSGEIMAKQLVRAGGREVELKSVNAGHADPVLDANAIEWMSRIIWVSQ